MLVKKPTRQPLLVRKTEGAALVGVSPWTLDKWVRDRLFPQPIYATDHSPAMWRVRDIEAWIEQRRRARRRKPMGGRSNLMQYRDDT